MHYIKKQTIIMEDPFNNDDTIIDLGGGGEGIIGILRGKQVTAIDIRQDELDEAPDGPIKILADAKKLPFKENHFSAATAFFFFMYIPASNRRRILEETYRVLMPGGFLHIWDVTIPQPQKDDKEIFVIPLKIHIQDKIIHTGYGVKWCNKAMSCEDICDLAQNTGFDVKEKNTRDQMFYTKLQKRN